MVSLGTWALAWAAAPVAAPKGWLADFWEQKWQTILAGVVALLIGIFLGEPIKAMVKWLGERLDRALQRFNWRFRKKYLAALAERHRWLKLIGVSHRVGVHRPRLQEVYISLRLAAGESADSPRFGWNEVFRPEERRLVILGGPGAGKSTLLDYLVLVFTGAVSHPLHALLGKPFPLLARLRALGSEGGPASLLELLAASTPLQRVPAGYPERQLDRGGCIVLLDGLDEVLDEGRHARAVEAIEQLVNEFPKNWYVVTCRVAGWRGQLPGFRTYEIQELGREDVHRFGSAWYREVLRAEKVDLLGARPEASKLAEAEAQAYTEARQRSEALWQALSANEGLLRIAGTPLLLSLIALVHYHQVRLPQGRAALYQDCLRVLLDLWDSQDKQIQLVGPSLNEKLLVLKAIAFHYLENDLLDADVATLETVVAPLLSQLKTPLPAVQLIEQIHERSGVLVEQALGRYGFAHRALHDYLAAAGVVESAKDDLLLARAAEERWREVILIAVGLAPSERGAKLVAALLGQESASGAELEMAGLALAEDVQLGDDLRAEVKQRLLDRLGREEAGATLGRLTAALIAADFEAARGWMEEVLRGRDGARRKRVLELLPELGAVHGKPLSQLLERLLAARDEAPELRAQAARALAGLGAADAAVWDALTEARKERQAAVKTAATWAWCELGRWEELGLVRVPAGEFLMGSRDGVGDSDERPQHALFLPTFYIGKAPVTLAQFRQFAGESGTKTTDEKALIGVAVHPVSLVTWYEALAYATWYGFSLPSEAEWEKAARGTDGRTYPWGNEWVAGRANSQELWSHRWSKRIRGATTPVGQFSPSGDSPYGCVDMAGNVWEWTRSLWGDDARSPTFGYPYVGTDGRENIEANPQMRCVLRGGSWINDSDFLRCAARDCHYPDYCYVDIGFRVVSRPHSPLVSNPSGLGISDLRAGNSGGVQGSPGESRKGLAPSGLFDFAGRGPPHPFLTGRSASWRHNRRTQRPAGGVSGRYGGPRRHKHRAWRHYGGRWRHRTAACRHYGRRYRHYGTPCRHKTHGCRHYGTVWRHYTFRCRHKELFWRHWKLCRRHYGDVSRVSSRVSCVSTRVSYVYSGSLVSPGSFLVSTEPFVVSTGWPLVSPGRFVVSTAGPLVSPRPAVVSPWPVPVPRRGTFVSPRPSGNRRPGRCPDGDGPRSPWPPGRYRSGPGHVSTAFGQP